MITKWSRIRAMSALVFLAAQLSQAQAVDYSVIPLGGTSSQAYGINESGQVVGALYQSPGEVGYAPYRATLWNGTTATTLANTYSNAFAINDTGVMAGFTASPDVLGTQATLWSGGGTTMLDSLGRMYSRVASINNAGHMAGSTNATGNSDDERATVWRDGVASELPTLGDGASDALDINEQGQIVGVSSLNQSDLRAVLWSAGTVTDLGNLGGTYTVANAINNRGQMVGSSTNDRGGNHAVLWNDLVMTDLDPDGEGESFAYDINDLGQVVGELDGHATLWNGLEHVDLNTFLDASMVDAGWVLTHAGAINEAGWIAVNGFNSQTQWGQAFLMAPTTAVPEPGVHALQALGLVAVACAIRRRKLA